MGILPQIIAIDPGASGGIAYREAGGKAEAIKMPDTEGDILETLRGLKMTHSTAVIEEVGGFIGSPQPGSAMFKFGRGVGFLLGVLMALRFRVETVRPQKWQATLGIGNSRTRASKAAWKADLKSLAQRKFPEAKVTLSTADALLMLEYGEKHL
jgi:hypothetical protein